MELVPWKPFQESALFRNDMERLWERFLGKKPAFRMAGQEWLPAVDISENKESFVVKAELPGMDATDVNVTISGDLLTIKGEKDMEEEEKDQQHYCVERYYGSFQRTFQLPSGVKSDEVQATFDKGVLKVMLPKEEEARKKEVKVKVKQ